VAKKKTGLGIEALFPQEEAPAQRTRAEEVPVQRARSRPRSRATPQRSPTKSAKASEIRQEASREERIKTSVELLPETIELIDQIKSQHRRNHHRHLPMWKILDEAVRELAERRLK